MEERNLELNLNNIRASAPEVRVRAAAVAEAAGWTFATYDSDLPETASNWPYSDLIRMDNEFGAPVHAVTFFDDNDKAESVTAGLFWKYPEVTWTELTRVLQTKDGAKYPFSPSTATPVAPKAPPTPQKFTGPVTSLFSGVSPFTGTR